MQAGFWRNSGVSSVVHAVRCNERTRSCLLFCRIDRSLLHTSGKYEMANVRLKSALIVSHI